MKPVVSVVAPCLNEAGNLPELVNRLHRVFCRKRIDGEIILVNDGSNDSTGAVADALCEHYPCLVVIHHTANLGIEAAWQSGLRRAGGDYICFIDADLQNLPEDVYRLLREIRLTGADLVQGYRSNIARPIDHRYFMSKGLNWILNTTFRMRQRDNKSGFVIARKDVLRDILTHRYRYRCFQTFITVSAASKGYVIREVETIFEDRTVGTSFLPSFPLRVIGWVLVDLSKAWVEFRRSPKREATLAEFLKENPPLRQDPQLTVWRRAWFRLFTLTMPLHKWMITRQARHYYDELKQSQYLTPAQVRQLQERKLCRLIMHCYHHVAYYRERMDQLGLKPTDIQTLEDLSRLPFLTKDDVRENLHFDLLSDNHDKKRILKVTTSGSTGEPFQVYADQHQLEIRWAATQRSMEWTGYRFGDRTARLWHQTLGMTFSQVLRERLDAFLTRRMFVPAFELTDRSIERFVARLKRQKPVLVDGYAESLNFLAFYIKQHGMSGFTPKAIMSSAQALPQQSREIIESTFSCGVFDKYGSREFSGIAYECEAHDGHHVVAESFIVEILKEGKPVKPGEPGEVVITDLNNLCVPLIRYRVGDVAVAMDDAQSCPCGRGLPRIGRIEGRVQSIIVAENGAYIPGTFFSHFFKDYEYVVRQYQVIQERKGAIRLRIVKGMRFEQASLDRLLQQLREYLGQKTVIDVEFTDRIEMGRTGKHHGVISKLAFDLQEDVGPLASPPL
jgi:phenylacetate-CoA ligase